MIISRTPFRVSFFGGGTDYPDWYREHGGAVLATTIDKYCYISVRELPPFFEHRFRLVYSFVENVKEISETRRIRRSRGVLHHLGVVQGPGDSSRRRPAGALGPRIEFGFYGRPDQRACTRWTAGTCRRTSWRSEAISRRAGRAARAGRRAGSDFGGIRRLQPHLVPPGRHLPGHADDPAARTSRGAAGPSAARSSPASRGLPPRSRRRISTTCQPGRRAAARCRTWSDRAIELLAIGRDDLARVRPAAERRLDAEAPALGSRVELRISTRSTTRRCAQARSAASCLARRRWILAAVRQARAPREHSRRAAAN